MRLRIFGTILTLSVALLAGCGVLSTRQDTAKRPSGRMVVGSTTPTQQPATEAAQAPPSGAVTAPSMPESIPVQLPPQSQPARPFPLTGGQVVTTTRVPQQQQQPIHEPPVRQHQQQPQAEQPVTQARHNPEPVVVSRPSPQEAPVPAIRMRQQAADEPVVALMPVPPAYSGPRSGVINWSGRLEKNGSIVLQDGLPGVPVSIELDTREFALAEAPAPSNQWSRIVIRSKSKRHSVVSIKWSVLQ